MSSWRTKGFFCREILLVRKLCGRMECLVLVLLRTIRTITHQNLFFSNYCVSHYDSMRSFFLTKGKDFLRESLHVKFCYNYAKIK